MWKMKKIYRPVVTSPPKEKNVGRKLSNIFRSAHLVIVGYTWLINSLIF